MSNREVVIGLVQMQPLEGAASSLKKAEAMTRDAAIKGAKIVILPELFLGPYFCQRENDESAFDRAEAIPGPSTKALSDLAKELKIVLIGGSIFEKSGAKYYNTACVFLPDGTMSKSYRKTHIPHDPDFFEQNYFAQGDTGILVHDTPFGKICVMICYDQWFPEAARIAALQGAELLVYPTAIGTAKNIAPVTPGIPEDWELMWRSAQVGHAAANCVYVATVNRVGDEDDMHFFGGSFVADPSAQLLVKGDDTEQVLLATCDFDHVQRMQKSWRFLEERRPKMYKILTDKNIRI